MLVHILFKVHKLSLHTGSVTLQHNTLYTLYSTNVQAAEALWGARETVFELFESIAKSPFAPLAAELELLPLARQVLTHTHYNKSYTAVLTVHCNQLCVHAVAVAVILARDHCRM
jgi:hypothetical protein